MLSGLQEKNYYELLSVPCNASMKEIQRAYEISKETFQGHSLATYSLFNDKETHEVFSLISEAFYTLSDPKLRQAYDAKMSQNSIADNPDENHIPPANGYHSVSPASEKHHVNGSRTNGSRTDAFHANASRSVAIANASRSIAPDVPSTFSQAESIPSPRVFFAEPKKKPTKNIAHKPSTIDSGSISLRYHAARSEADNLRSKSHLIKQKEQLGNLLEPGQTFNGETLKRAREACGYSLAGMAEETKIRYTYLDCLEKEDFRALPSRIYVRGFLALICDTVGLDPKHVCKDYMKIYDQQVTS